MDVEEFRRRGHETIDWVADYLTRIESFPVRSRAEPGEVRGMLPATPPEAPEPYERILEDLDRIILPGITHWQAPAFFGYFPANSSPPSILGELVSAGLGVQGMMWATSPACTELETHVLDWLATMLDLPAAFLSTGPGGGVIQDTASSATLCALLAARDRATGYTSQSHGLSPGLTVYASDQAHSSLEKAVVIAGLGTRQLRSLPTRPETGYTLEPGLLAAAIREDRARGLKPCFVFATVGTTSSNAIDPIRAVGEICAAEGLWYHVDGAMCGTAALCPELRWIHDGLELADSYCCNPHKWMLTNFDCDAFYLRDRQALLRCLAIQREYYRNAPSAAGAVIDYRDWQIPLGRRFRALKLWFVIRSYGVEGLRAHVRGHLALAQQLRGWVRESPHFELAAPAPLSLICFRHKAGDAATQRVLDAVNDGGRMFISPTRLSGRLTLRFAIGGTWTQERHVAAAWEELSRAAQSA